MIKKFVYGLSSHDAIAANAILAKSKLQRTIKSAV